jgi:polar amino acid transport system permease protein
VDVEALLRLAPYLLKGLYVTALLNLISIPIAAAIGLLIAVMRLSPSRALAAIGGVVSDFLRSTPFLVQVVWLFYALPILTGIQFDKFATGCLALSVYAAAYYAEVYRAGILAVPLGQSEAALGQGMTKWQALRRIVLPQAVPMVLPAFVGTVVIQIKESAIVSVIAVGDLMFTASTLAASSRKALEVLTVAALLYVLLAYPPTILANYLHARAVRSA